MVSPNGAAGGSESSGDALAALIDDHTTLAVQIKTFIHQDKTLEQCLDLVAVAFGYDSHSNLTTAYGRTGAATAGTEDILKFWQSPALSDFITDYACRRRPVVLALGSDGGIIAAESQPNNVFEIQATPNGFTVFDLGMGPYSPQNFNHIRIPLHTHATISQAFASLAKAQNWDWTP